MKTTAGFSLYFSCPSFRLCATAAIPSPLAYEESQSLTLQGKGQPGLQVRPEHCRGRERVKWYKGMSFYGQTVDWRGRGQLRGVKLVYGLLSVAPQEQPDPGYLVDGFQRTEQDKCLTRKQLTRAFAGGCRVHPVGSSGTRVWHPEIRPRRSVRLAHETWKQQRSGRAAYLTSDEVNESCRLK